MPAEICEDRSMNITPITAPTSMTQVPSASKNLTFKSMLTKLTSQNEKKVKEAHEAAAGLVSMALIMPILKQIRRSQFNTEGPFSPGTGEKAFGPEFDMQISNRIAHSPRLGVTEALTQRLLKRGTPAKAASLKGLNVNG
jgi:hypothetical protein